MPDTTAATTSPPASTQAPTVEASTSPQEAPQNGQGADPQESGQDASLEAAIARVRAEEGLTAEDAPKEAGSQAEPTRLEKISAAAAKAKKAATRNRQLTQETQRLQREYQATQARMADLQKQAERGQLLERMGSSDPLAFLEKIGHNPQALVERALIAGSPEAQIQALKAQIEQDRAALEAERKALKAQHEQEAGKARAEAYYVASQNAEEYPHLARLPRQVLLDLGNSVINRSFQKTKEETGTGVRPSDRQVLRYLNKQFALKETRAETPTTQTSGTKETQAAAGKEKTKPTHGPMTLTNGLGSSAFTLPANWQDLTPNERQDAFASWLDSRRK